MARQDRETVLAKMRARSKRLREADIEGYRAKQRERYANNRDTIRGQLRASYQRHREKRLEQEKAAKIADPEKAALRYAKRRLSEVTGVRIRDIPDDLAAAKAVEIEITRMLKGAQQ